MTSPIDKGLTRMWLKKTPQKRGSIVNKKIGNLETSLRTQKLNLYEYEQGSLVDGYHMLIVRGSTYTEGFMTDSSHF